MNQPLFVANGIITLSTDFGEREPFVGLMKGVILGRYPAARVIDLCHGLPKFQPQLAGFWLARCWPYFSKGTLHLAVVDPGVGGDRAMKCLQLDGQLFVAPDNGLLDSLQTHPACQDCRVFELVDLQHLQLGSVSRTFHGRDVFAPLVAELAAGRQRPESLGRQLSSGADAEAVRQVAFNEISGQILVIDDFGNLLSDIDAERCRSIDDPVIEYAGQVIEIKDTYSSVEPGKVLGLINSFGVLEIAVAQGSAQQRFQTQTGSIVRVRPRK